MESNIKLTKSIYGYKGAIEKLDEEFNEFALNENTTKEFFELYHRYFYNFERNTHNTYYTRSSELAYPDGYINPRYLEIDSLTDQIKSLRYEINSVERHHFFFKNHIFLMDAFFDNDPTAQLMDGTGVVYYVQSSRKRKINNYQTYINLKTRVRRILGEIDDKEFITFLSNTSLAGMSTGPDIVDLEDIFISVEAINIWPKTPVVIGHDDDTPNIIRER
mgnify:CR=1 FL=1